VRRRDFLTLGSAALAVRGLTTTARAASNYPERPVRLIIPFPPGGGFDAVGRPWADRIKPRLGTIVVENQGGGGSSLGAAFVAHSSPDGYTLLLGGSSTHVTEAILKTRPLYDPIKDLEPISNIAVSPFALAVHPSVPATTLAEFINYDKANRATLPMGTRASARSIISPANYSSRLPGFRIFCRCRTAARDRLSPTRWRAMCRW
jgi:tripartite-type tricarboxylate transporter receptor subunit TctC